MNGPQRAVLEMQCKELRLSTLFKLTEKYGRAAQDEGWPYEQYLERLLEAEINQRRSGAVERRIKAARFLDTKTFEQLDWAALKGVSAGRWTPRRRTGTEFSVLLLCCHCASSVTLL